MPPLNVCPSMGAISRPGIRNLGRTTNRCSRSFHASVRRLEDGSEGKAATPPPAPSIQRSPRRARNAQAASDVSSLQFRRPLPRSAGLAGGSFVSGRSTRESADGDAPFASAPPPGAKILTPRQPLRITREPVDSPFPRRGGVGPPGPMARLTRNAPNAPRNTGPNLRGRQPRGGGAGRGGGARGGRGRGGGGAKRRERGGGGDGPDPTRLGQEVAIGDGLSDGMVQHLLRLQRKEWDRVPYEPKYAPGSFAANELIHAGRELFRGEAPPIKVWGRLEKKLNIVGMHNAEAHLQVRRMPTETMTATSEYRIMKKMGINNRLPSLPLSAAEQAEGLTKKRAAAALRTEARIAKVKQVAPPEAAPKVEAQTIEA